MTTQAVKIELVTGRPKMLKRPRPVAEAWLKRSLSRAARFLREET